MTLRTNAISGYRFDSAAVEVANPFTAASAESICCAGWPRICRGG